MALNLYLTYPDNTDTGDQTNYPIGKARNETISGQKDWFPLEKTWINEILGFLGAILSAAGYSPDGVAEKAGASQYLDGIRALEVPVSKLSNGYRTLTSSGLFFGSDTMGKANFNGYPGQSGSFETIAPDSKTNRHKALLEAGYLQFLDAPGIGHKLFPIYYSIDLGYVTRNTSLPYYLLVANGSTGITFTGINYGNVYSTQLILSNNTGDLLATLPLAAYFRNVGGELNMVDGLAATSYSPPLISNYDHAYIHMWINPALIS